MNWIDFLKKYILPYILLLGLAWYYTWKYDFLGIPDVFVFIAAFMIASIFAYLAYRNTQANKENVINTVHNE